MDMTEKNGQPSMEEILASIRRIVAEEPETQHAPSSAPIIDFRNNPITLNGDGVLDDASEFDLPAIFRSSSTPQPEKPGPLIGRLTDAIRNATSSQSEPKQQPEVRQMQVVEDGSERDEPTVGRFGAQSESYQALSALKSVRHETPAQDTTETTPAEPQKAASQGWNFTRAASPPPAAIKEEIKRVMAPFKDTHFTRMSGPAPAPAALAPPAQAQPAPAVEAQKPAPVQAPTPAPASEPSRPVDFGAIIPARFERPAAVEAEMRAPAQPQSSSFGQPLRPEPQPQTLPSTPLAAVPLGPRPVEAAQLPADPPALPHNPMSLTPPPLTLVSSDASDAHADGQATGTIEDTTAELLRPMLRAWLSDNMPRMVEKALHIEVAESVKTGKKPTGI